VKGQRFLFSGKELDEETGLYYFGARYYDPVRVRWASIDPADRFEAPQTSIVLHPYQYGLWRPGRMIDPDGRAERDKTVQGAAEGAGTQPANDAIARARHNSEASRLDPSSSSARTELKMRMREQPSPAGKVFSEVKQPAGTPPRVGGAR
jgi:RHS repeat-associated protein